MTAATFAIGSTFSDAINSLIDNILPDRTPQTPNHLTGFDMVWAITQNTINSQMQWLAAMPGALPVTEAIGSLADPEQITIGTGKVVGNQFDQPPAIGAPLVDFNTGQPGTVHFKLPLASAQAAYLVANMEKRTFDVETVDISGSVFGFEVKVNIASRARADLQKGLKIPPEILTQLESFDDSQFEIASIFLNFEDSNLANFDAAISSYPDTLKPAFAAMVNAAMGKFLADKVGTDNPFVLGHIASRKSTPPADELLAPTGTNYSTTPYMVTGRQPTSAELGLSTFNFLLVGGGRSIVDNSQLSGPGAGMFNTNFVSSNDYDGVGVIDLGFFARNYLSSLIVEPLGKRITDVFGDYRHARDDRGPAVTVHEDTGTLVTTDDLKWHYGQDITLDWHESGFNSHDRESQRRVTYDVQLMNKPDPAAGNATRLALEIRGTFYRYEWDQLNTDIPPFKSNVYVGKGWGSATYNSVTTIYFTAGQDGTITLQLVNDPVAAPVTDSGTDGAYNFADFFSGLFGLDKISEDWNDNAARLGGEELTNSDALQEASKGLLQAVATRVVLPAPHVFFYRDVLLNAQNDIEVRLTYKTQA